MGYSNVGYSNVGNSNVGNSNVGNSNVGNSNVGNSKPSGLSWGELPQSFQGLPLPPELPGASPGAKVVFRFSKTLLLHTRRIHRKRCHELRLRPSLPHAPGARMTVV